MHKEEAVDKKQKEQHDYIFKIILLGCSNVGKTALIRRFVHKTFVADYSATIGIDFQSVTISLENMKVKLQIWDTAGQEKFQAITSSHYKGAHGCLCVFDLTSQESLSRARQFLKTSMEGYAVPAESTFLIANKQDLIDKRTVTDDEIEKLGQEFDARIIHCSAKDDINVETIFNELTLNLISRVKLQEHIPIQARKFSAIDRLDSMTEADESKSCC